MARLLLTAIAAAVCGLAGASELNSDDLPGAAAAPVREVGLESWRTFDFTSAINGQDYRVVVYTPKRAPPPGGFPTLYLLDGDAVFGTFAEAVRTRWQAGEIEPAVVVGISGTPGPRGGDRSFDFTPTQLSEVEKTTVKDFGPEEKFGGAEAFFRVIQTEIRPRIAELASIDPKRSALFGWSLGGQFVLHTLFEHPQSFSTYLALSQSIWWNNRVLIKDLPAFEDRVAREHLAPNIYIGVGGLEQTVPKGVLPKSFTREAMARELRHACMVDNVRELATSLKAWGRAHGLTINSRVFDHQTHNSVPWVAIDPILDFALPRRSPQDGPK